LFAQNISRASNPTYKCYYYFRTPLDKKTRISGVANNFFVSVISIVGWVRRMIDFNQNENIDSAVTQHDLVGNLPSLN
jgi:hypothetical protein